MKNKKIFVSIEEREFHYFVVAFFRKCESYVYEGSFKW